MFILRTTPDRSDFNTTAARYTSAHRHAITPDMLHNNEYCDSYGTMRGVRALLAQQPVLMPTLEACLLMEVSEQEMEFRQEIVESIQEELKPVLEREVDARHIYDQASSLWRLRRSEDEYNAFLARHNIDMDLILKNLDETRSLVDGLLVKCLGSEIGDYGLPGNKYKILRQSIDMRNRFLDLTSEKLRATPLCSASADAFDNQLDVILQAAYELFVNTSPLNNVCKIVLEAVASRELGDNETVANLARFLLASMTNDDENVTDEQLQH